MENFLLRDVAVIRRAWGGGSGKQAKMQTPLVEGTLKEKGEAEGPLKSPAILWYQDHPVCYKKGRSTYKSYKKNCQDAEMDAELGLYFTSGDCRLVMRPNASKTPAHQLKCLL